MEVDAVDHKQLVVVLAPLIVEENTEDSHYNLEEEELIKRIDQLRERIRMLIDRQVQDGQQVVPENPGNIINKGNVQNDGNIEDGNHGNLEENDAFNHENLVEENPANHEN